MTGPAVSVIVPTYNRAETTLRALDSVIRQTFADWELILVDDGSIDNTHEMVESIQDPRIRLLRHLSNRGAAAARNTGLRAARGIYVAFLDSDDEWLPSMLEACVAAFQTETGIETPGAVRCDAIFVSQNGEQLHSLPDGWVYEAMLSGDDGIVISALILSRQALDQGHEFDESTRLVEDRDFLLPIAKNHRFVTVHQPLVRIHSDQGDHMNVPLNRLIIRQRFLKKHGAELDKRPRVKARHYGTMGRTHLEMADAVLARKAFAKAIGLDPRSPRWYVWFALTLFGDRGAPIVAKVAKQWLARARQVTGRTGLNSRKGSRVGGT